MWKSMNPQAKFWTGVKLYEFCNESQGKKPPGLQDAKKCPCTEAFPADQH